MSKSNAFETDLLLLIFNNTNIATLGDATGVRGSTVVGNLYLALHTADPGEAGDQTTSEATFTSYARVAVPRSGAGWTVAGNAVTNAAAIPFAPAGSGPQLITHWSLGYASSGAGKILYKGALTPNPTANSGVTINIPAGDLDITED
jgi:hypothetical protein